MNTLPSLTAFNEEYQARCYVEHRSNLLGRKTFFVIQPIDFAGLIFGKFGIGRQIPAAVVAYMGKFLNIFQVFRTIVVFVAVAVVNVASTWSRANKRLGNFSVDHCRKVTTAALDQVNHQIARCVNAWRQDFARALLSGGCSVPVTHGNNSVNAANASQVANLVSAFVARNVAPLFNWFVCGIIGVHKNLQFLCQAQDVSRVAGHFVLVYCSFILAHLDEYGKTLRVADLLEECAK